jgi:hypothetical protein
LAWDIKMPKLQPASEPANPLRPPVVAPDLLVEEEALISTSVGD